MTLTVLFAIICHKMAMLASSFLNSDKTVPSSKHESVSYSSSGVSVQLIIEVFLGFGKSFTANYINFNIIFIINTYISSSSSSSTITYMILHVSSSLLLLLLLILLCICIYSIVGYVLAHFKI